jgi:hypothetical protein
LQAVLLITTQTANQFRHHRSTTLPTRIGKKITCLFGVLVTPITLATQAHSLL